MSKTLFIEEEVQFFKERLENPPSKEEMHYGFVLKFEHKTQLVCPKCNSWGCAECSGDGFVARECFCDICKGILVKPN